MSNLTILSNMTDVLSKQLDVDTLETVLLEEEQVSCPVMHHFGSGVYIREVTIPAGTFAIGHHQKFPHMNFMVKGKVIVPDGNGGTETLTAPLMYNGASGRKIGYVIEDVVWLNIYPNYQDVTDIDFLESVWLDKSQASEEYVDKKYKLRVDDIEDYYAFLKEAGISEEYVRSSSDDLSVYKELSTSEIGKMTIRNSNIQGKGVFLSYPAEAGEMIAVAAKNGYKTQAGRFVNHSKEPNAEYINDDFGNTLLICIKDIKGCVGGDIGEEVTVDYRKSPMMLDINKN